MATTVAQPRSFANPTKALPGRRYDHYFFSGTALLMLASVLVGFGPTYYFAGMLRAPLPSPIIHVHGAAFSCWILLLVTQTSLVSSHRVDIHMRLGIAGFLLATCMVVIGVWAATDRLARGSSPAGFDPYFFYIVPLTDMVTFGTLIFFAFRYRRDSDFHKRIIYVATTALLTAAVARWPWAFVHRNAPKAAMVTWAFLVALAIYDWRCIGKVHRATVKAGSFMIAVQLFRLPIGKTAAWHGIASWIQSLAR